MISRLRDIIVKFFTSSGSAKHAVKLTDHEMITMAGMYNGGVSIQDTAAVMYLSESRVKYEYQKLDRAREVDYD